jgi:GDPmannose 4,6-dehydratase
MDYYRPTEVDILLGDASKAKRILGWEPVVKFKELIHIMVDADLRKARIERGGYPDPQWDAQ